MTVELCAVVLAFIDLALVGLLALAWRDGRDEDRRRLKAVRREMLAWLQETKKLERGEVPSWLVEP